MSRFIYSITRRGDEYPTTDWFVVETKEEAIQEVFARFNTYFGWHEMLIFSKRNPAKITIEQMITEMDGRSGDRLDFLFDCNKCSYIIKNCKGCI